MSNLRYESLSLSAFRLEAVDRAWCALWEGSTHPTRTLCGEVVYWKMVKAILDRGEPSAERFNGSDLVLDKTLDRLTIRFVCDEFPLDARFNGELVFSLDPPLLGTITTNLPAGRSFKKDGVEILTTTQHRWNLWWQSLPPRARYEGEMACSKLDFYSDGFIAARDSSGVFVGVDKYIGTEHHNSLSVRGSMLKWMADHGYSKVSDEVLP